jgi:hypothetical protein
VDAQTDHAEVSLQTATLAVGIPVAVYVASMWALHRSTLVSRGLAWASGVAIVAVIAASLVGAPILTIGLILAALIAVNAAVRRTHAAGPVGQAAWSAGEGTAHD